MKVISFRWNEGHVVHRCAFAEFRFGHTPMRFPGRSLNAISGTFTHCDVVDPVPDVEEGFLVRHVVQQENSVCSSEIGLGDAPESFLT